MIPVQNPQEIADTLSELNPDALLANGFEEALIGYTTCFLADGNTNPVAVYSRPKCIDILMKRDGMTYEDANEFFAFNTDGAYVGKNGPIFVEIVRIPLFYSGE